MIGIPSQSSFPFKFSRILAVNELAVTGTIVVRLPEISRRFTR